jgi:hypothetical protein
MATLYRLISVGGETAGFLLPVFHAYRGTNQELIQQIDEHDNVLSFETIIHDGPSLPNPDRDMEAHVGGPAIWAFRDHDGHVCLGSGSVIQSIGLELLASGALDQFPMAAAEMVAFCAAEVRFAGILQSALRKLARISPKGAETWRDTILLLPVIKQDLARYISHGVRAEIADVLAITRGHVTHIYAPPSVADRVTQLPRWNVLAKIFGINRFEVHATKSRPGQKGDPRPVWSIYGIGGIARLVIQRPPFYGSSRTPAAPPSGAFASGPGVSQNSWLASEKRLIIAVVPSDRDQAAMLNRVCHSDPASGAMKHAINIRPIGFGTPRADKPSPKQLSEVLNGFDCLWIIANHRQRQVGSFPNSFSASHAASRFVRATASGLISCLASREGLDVLSEAGRERGFGLVGARRYKSSIGMDGMMRSVLYSMLCEDAYLHSARRIVILWPYAVEQRQHLALGARYYEVDVIARPQQTKYIDVVGFAINVQLSDRTETDFRDFCVSLVAGYGWNARQDDGRSILLENEGEAIRIWPVISAAAGMKLIAREAEFGSYGDIIISNQTVSAAMRSQAEVMGWGLAHYSELGRLMKTEFRMGIFEDL